MIKLIFKRIWVRRKSNVWLVLNIFVISLLMVSLIDSVTQFKNFQSEPCGFEYTQNNTYIADCARLYVNEENIPSADVVNSFEDIINQLRENSSVEKVSILTTTFMGGLINYPKNIPISNASQVNVVDTEFFEIFEPKLICGSSTQSRNFKDSWNSNQEIMPIIASKELIDNNYYVEEFIRGRGVKYSDDINYEKHIGSVYEVKGDDGKVRKYKIMAITETTFFKRPTLTKTFAYMPFSSRDEFIANNYNIMIAIKAKEGRVLDLESLNISENNIHRIISLKLFDTYIDETSEGKERRTFTFNIVLVVLFFVSNLILGVFGSFWYRTLKRKAEIGLKMAMGANPFTIFRELLIEAIIILSIGYIPTFIIAANQFYFGIRLMSMSSDYLTIDYFIVIVAISYIAMLVLIVIGTFFPALKAMRTKPAEALGSDK